MSEYTSGDDPARDDVREWYIDGRRVHNPFASDAELVKPFDAWLAAHDADVRKAALEEADNFGGQRAIALGIEDGLRELGAELHGCTPSMLVLSIQKRIASERSLIRAAALGDAPQKTEPTVDEWREAIHAERERQIAKGYDLQHDRAAGPGHLISWAIDYARRGKTFEVSAMLLALSDVLALGDAPTGGE